MKPLLFLAIATIAISCSKPKETFEKPTQEDAFVATELPYRDCRTEDAISGTFWHHVYDNHNAYVGTELSFHVCQITDPVIIAQWRAYPQNSKYCDDNDILELVLGDACPDGECFLKDSGDYVGPAEVNLRPRGSGYPVAH